MSPTQPVFGMEGDDEGEGDLGNEIAGLSVVGTSVSGMINEFS
jgi:hypothetical protein